MSFTMKVGDNRPLVVTLNMDLVGRSVFFSMRHKWGSAAVVINDGPCEILNAEVGQVRYRWRTGENTSPGAFAGEFTIVDADEVETNPSSGTIEIKIEPRIGDVPTPPPPGPTLYPTYTWVERNTAAPFLAADGAMLVHAFGRFWRIGGWNPPLFAPHVTTNEIWSSDDLFSWTQDFAYDATPPLSGTGARFKKRHWFGCEAVTLAGVEYIYVMGGDGTNVGDSDFAGTSNGYSTDIWRWRGPGFDWERVLESDAAPWAGRMLTVYGQSPGGVLWAFGGQDGLLGELTSTLHNDLYKSTDGGFTWVQVLADGPATATRPSARGIINRLLFFAGRMWLVSGGTYDTTDHPNRSYFKEVWSFDPADGAVWSRHQTPPWEGVMYNSVEVFNGRLFLLAGYAGEPNAGFAGVNTRTVYSSADGERWERHETPPWPPSHADGTCVVGALLAHVSGNADVLDSISKAYELDVSEAVAPDVDAMQAGWEAAANVRTSATALLLLNDVAGGFKHMLVPTSAQWAAADEQYGTAPSARALGGRFLASANPVDLSAFVLFLVCKPYASTGLFYFAYALSGGDYFYLAGNQNGGGGHPDQTTLQVDVHKSGVSTTGFENNLPFAPDMHHIVAFVFDGTAAGSSIRIDGADQKIPLVGNAGTGLLNAVLNLFSDNTGAGSKPGTLAAARLYPLISPAKIEEVERELRALYPYRIPTVPTVVSLAPTTGSPAGGTSVQITVADSTDCRAAYVGGVALSSFSIIDPVTVGGVTGAHAAGVVDVVVENITGQSAPLVGAFTYA